MCNALTRHVEGESPRLVEKRPWHLRLRTKHVPIELPRTPRWLVPHEHAAIDSPGTATSIVVMFCIPLPVTLVLGWCIYCKRGANGRVSMQQLSLRLLPLSPVLYLP